MNHDHLDVLFEGKRAFHNQKHRINPYDYSTNEAILWYIGYDLEKQTTMLLQTMRFVKLPWYKKLFTKIEEC